MIFTGWPAATSSCSALRAPAWIDFQNSCVVPFGITTIDKPLPEGALDLEPQPKTKTNAAHAAPSSNDFMRGRLGDLPRRDKLFAKKDLRGEGGLERLSA